MKKSIEITPNIETLFGTRDENLHVLEDGLNINIDLRSDHIELEGAPRDVARAEQLFADYDHLQRSGRPGRLPRRRRSVSSTSRSNSCVSRYCLMSLRTRSAELTSPCSTGARRLWTTPSECSQVRHTVVAFSIRKVNALARSLNSVPSR